jgi:hypothetical protein
MGAAERLAALARAVLDAETPERHAAALAALLDVLAEDAAEGAQRCAEAWGERSAGAPWARHARALERAAAGWRKRAEGPA